MTVKVVDTKYSTNKVAVSQYTSKVYRVLSTHNFADSSSLYKSMYVSSGDRKSFKFAVWRRAINWAVFSKRKVEFGF